jgi:hypothetical protein
VAKKARRKIEEAEERDAFQFPDFDERKFLAHEYEQSIATAAVVGWAILLAAVAWETDHLRLPTVVGWVAGLIGVVAVPFYIGGIRPLSTEYTKGDWGWLILTAFMGWIGLWFLFLNLFPA